MLRHRASPLDRSWRPARPAGAALGTALLALWLLAACGHGRATADGTSLRELRERWGIVPVALRSSAAGYMLDFRYRVVDAAKAAPLFERSAKVALVVPATGARLQVHRGAKVGPLRSTQPPIAGRTYFILFANPGKYLAPGAVADVVIGDMQAQGLVVE
jgi:hypothetical protein